MFDTNARPELETLEPRLLLSASAMVDFNADGQADILWRNIETGANAVWYMKDGQFSSAAALDKVTNLDWRMVGGGDFNGDGFTDIVWSNDVTGVNAIWLMKETTRTGSALLPSAPAGAEGYQLAAVADMDGDDQPDLVWFDANHYADSYTSKVAVTLMNGLAVADTDTTLTGPAGELVGAGDFDGNDKADLVYRNAVTGENFVQLDALSAPSVKPLPAETGPEWRIRDAGDYDGDGDADLFWHNQFTGDTMFWEMNDQSLVLQKASHTVSSGWVPAGADQWTSPNTTDFNGDGFSDLFWRNDESGRNVMWWMQGEDFLGGASTTTVADSDWQIGAVVDANDDGQADVIWQNRDLGMTLVWYLADGERIGSGLLPDAPSTTSTLVAGSAGPAGSTYYLFWQDVGGQIIAYQMDGLTRTGQQALGNESDSAWKIVGAGLVSTDKDDDGSMDSADATDLIWFNYSTGAMRSWLMDYDDFTHTLDTGQSIAFATRADLNWQVGAVADMNNDGYSDIVWRNAESGANQMWWMNEGNQQVVSMREATILSWRMATQRSWQAELQITEPVAGDQRGELDGKVWSLGAVRQGRGDLTGSLVIANTGNVTMTLDTVIGGSAFSIVQDLPSSLAPGQQATLIVKFTQGSLTGISAGVLQINTNDPASPSALLTLKAHVTAVDDFNGDGYADILWRNAETGANVIWLMQQENRTDVAVLPKVANTDWVIAGSGDFNDDGWNDIVWRNAPSGVNVVWYMKGVERIGADYLDDEPAFGLAVAGVGDVTADDTDDLLWYSVVDRAVYTWWMDQTDVTDAWQILDGENSSQDHWWVAATGDFNSDGRDDLVVRYADGSNYVFYMDSTGATLSGGFSLADETDPDWQIVGAADYNRDGYTDLLWRNTYTGENRMWLLNASQSIFPLTVKAVGDTDWEIAGPIVGYNAQYQVVMQAMQLGWL